MAADTTTIQLQRDVERLKALSETEKDRCPYRETIARAVNSTEQIKTMRDDLDDLTGTVTNLRIDFASMSTRIAVTAGLSSGGGLAVVGGIIAAIGKALGYW